MLRVNMFCGHGYRICAERHLPFLYTKYIDFGKVPTKIVRRQELTLLELD